MVWSPHTLTEPNTEPAMILLQEDSSLQKIEIVVQQPQGCLFQGNTLPPLPHTMS